MSPPLDLFRLRETIFMNMQIRRDVILDTLMAAVNVLRQRKMKAGAQTNAAGCALFKGAGPNTINLFRNVQVCDAKNAEDFSKTLQKRGVRSKPLREKLSAIKWK